MADKDLTLREALDMIMDRFDKQDKRMDDMASSLKNFRIEVEVIKERIEKIESPPFDPSRTVCISGLASSYESNDMQCVQNLLSSVGLDNGTVKNIKRMQAYGKAPGLLKVELERAEDKIEVLRAKMEIRERNPNIWIRSSKTMSERVMEENFAVMLSMFPEGNKWKLASDGRLILKKEYRENEEGTKDTEVETENSSQNKPQNQTRIQSIPFGANARGGAHGGGPNCMPRGTYYQRGSHWSRSYRGGNRYGFGRGRGGNNSINHSNIQSLADFPYLEKAKTTPGKDGVSPDKKKQKPNTPSSEQESGIERNTKDSAASHTGKQEQTQSD